MPSRELQDVLKSNIELLSEDAIELYDTLLEKGQGHLVQCWPPKGKLDDEKKTAAIQLKHLESRCLYVLGLFCVILLFHPHRQLQSVFGACPASCTHCVAALVTPPAARPAVPCPLFA